MTILCEANEAAAAAVLTALGDGAQAVPSLSDAALALASNAREDTVVVGPDISMDEVAEFARQVMKDRPETKLIVLRHAIDDVLRAEATGVGIAELVPASAWAKELPGALQRAHGHVDPEDVADASAPETRPRAGRVVTVFSPKGGSGKTTTSTNLAAELADLGAKVCLVDLDLEFGDVAISLGLVPKQTIVDAVSAHTETAVDDLERLITEYRPNLDCLLAPIEPGDAARISPALVAALLAGLRPLYDVVVIDTPSQLSEHVLAAFDASTHFVLLTNPELTALKNLRLTLDMLDLLGYNPAARSIVFNKEDASVGLNAKEVEDALRWPLAVHIPATRDVPASINRGVPLAVSNPTHPLSTALRRFAQERILGVTSVDAPGGSSRLFRRRSA